MVKARHSVRTVTSNLAASALGLPQGLLQDVSWQQQGMDAMLLESWLTQQEEQHEVRAGLALAAVNVFPSFTPPMGVCNSCPPLSPFFF
jgi:hypothetical protein